MYTCISSFWISFPFRSPQSIEQSSLCYTICCHQLSLLYIVSIVYIPQSQSPHQFIPPHHFLPWDAYVCPPRLSLYSCFANKIIRTIFLDSTDYIGWYMIFAFLLLTYFTLYKSLGPSMSLWMTQFCSFLGLSLESSLRALLPNWSLFPAAASGKEPACKFRSLKSCWFDPFVRKIPWRRAWQPTPVFLPGESHGQRSP